MIQQAFSMKYLTKVKRPYVSLTIGKAVHGKLKQNCVKKLYFQLLRTFPNVNSFKWKFSLLPINWTVPLFPLMFLSEYFNRFWEWGWEKKNPAVWKYFNIVQGFSIWKGTSCFLSWSKTQIKDSSAKKYLEIFWWNLCAFWIFFACVCSIYIITVRELNQGK